MRCKPRNRSRINSARAGFTLAEVLAAMLFLAIVVPVAVAGLRVASHAGEVAARKAVAARIADRVLNEMIITGQAQKNAQTGKVTEGPVEYTWNLTIESSGLDTMRLATVVVNFPAQGQEYGFKLSTLVASE